MNQLESTGVVPPRLHRLFQYYDPEVVAILVILLGLFQVLLGVPTYFFRSDAPLLFVCLLSAGTVHVTGGSFAVVCERSPSRQWLKNCLYCTLGGLVLGVISTVVYGYSYKRIQALQPCEDSDYHFYEECPRDLLVGLFERLTALISLYDVVAIILQTLLLISAIKGLKANRN